MESALFCSRCLSSVDPHSTVARDGHLFHLVCDHCGSSAVREHVSSQTPAIANERATEADMLNHFFGRVCA